MKNLRSKKSVGKRVSGIWKQLCSCLILTMLLAILPGSGSAQSAAAQAAEEREELTVTAEASCTAKELQELLNLNYDGGYELTVKVPSGTYELDRQLVIYSHTTLLSEDGAVYLRTNQKYGSLIGNQYASVINQNASVSERIVIDGGCWDGNAKKYPHAGESICFTHASEIVIRNAAVCNVSNGSHLITFGGVTDALVENCELYGYTGTTAKEAVHLDIVHSKSQVPVICPVDSYDDASCRNIVITNNKIHDYPRGVGSHVSVDGVYHHDITINNNYFYNITEEAVKAYNYAGLNVKNNEMSQVGLGIRFYTWISGSNYLEPLEGTVKEEIPDNYRAVISGNTIQGTTGEGTSGYGIQLIGSEERMLIGVTISKNKISDITNSSVYGIRLAYCSQAAVSQNEISNTANGGITLVNCRSCKLKSNKIKSVARYGIYTTESPKSTIYANSVSETGDTGILVNNSSTSSSIGKNKVWNTGNHGIYVYTASSKCKVYENTVKNTKGNGIFIYKADDVTVKKNTVKNSQSDGLHIGTSNGTSVTGNTVEGSAGNAITVTKQAAGCNVSTQKK